MNQVIVDYIENIGLEWQANVCHKLDEIIHAAIPDVEERIQYRKPHYLKNGKYACVVGTAKAWVSFTIFNAQNLDAPEGLFEPTDAPERQTIKIKDGQDIDYDLLESLVRQAASTI